MSISCCSSMALTVSHVKKDILSEIKVNKYLSWFSRCLSSNKRHTYLCSKHPNALSAFDSFDFLLVFYVFNRQTFCLDGCPIKRTHDSAAKHCASGASLPPSYLPLLLCARARRRSSRAWPRGPRPRRRQGGGCRAPGLLALSPWLLGPRVFSLGALPEISTDGRAARELNLELRLQCPGLAV